MITRRGILGGLAGVLAAGFAPAAIGSGVLMPARKIARVAQFDPRDPFGQRGYIDGDWWVESIEQNKAWMTAGKKAGDTVIMRKWVPYGNNGAITCVDEKVVLTA